MSLLAVKLRRDLRVSWSRFVLMVIALAVSLTVFGGMLFAWTAIGRETEQAYLSTEPASATIVLEEGVDLETMARITGQARTQSGVLEATGRTQFDSQVEINGAPRDVQLQTFVAAPDDPMRMVRFDLRREGSWPPAPEEIWLGGDGTLDLLGVAVGDTVTVTMPGGQRAGLRVAGTVYDPSLAPSPQEQTGHGYLSAASLAALGQQAALLDQLKIQVAGPGQTEPSRDRGAVVAVASEVGAWLRSEHGLTVAEIQVPQPYAHPHQWQVDVLLLSLLAGGAAALLLAAILVATMLNTLFTQQIPQLGIMKAIGARSVRIGRWYLAMILLVATAATLLALYPAMVIGQDRVEGLTGLLGIQPTSTAASWWTYLVVVAVGLGLPVLLALPPLVKASRITVRAAIDHHGGAAKPSRATGVLARLGRVRRFDRGLLMALRNTVRRPARFWLSVGLLASAGMVFVAGMSLRSGTEAVDEEKKAQRYWDVEVALPGHQHLSRPGTRQHRGEHRAGRRPASPTQSDRRPLAQSGRDRGCGAQQERSGPDRPRVGRRRRGAAVPRGKVHHLARRRHRRGARLHWRWGVRHGRGVRRRHRNTRAGQPAARHHRPARRADPPSRHHRRELGAHRRRHRRRGRGLGQPAGSGVRRAPGSGPAGAARCRATPGVYSVASGWPPR